VLNYDSASRKRSRFYSNAPSALLDLVHIERLGRRAVDHRSGSDVEQRTMALTHDCRAFEQASGKWTWRVGARAEIVKRIQAIVHTRDRDPLFAASR
jgi:hypothetical protein